MLSGIPYDMPLGADVLLTSGISLTFEDGQVLLQPKDMVTPDTGMQTSPSPSHRELVIDAADLSPAQRNDLAELLYLFKNTFADDMLDFPGSFVREHVINKETALLYPYPYVDSLRRNGTRWKSRSRTC